jgi:hypothetical protein
VCVAWGQLLTHNAQIASPSAQEWDRLESSLKDLAYSSAATHARESEDADFI